MTHITKQNYKIHIQPYQEGELYRKSMENLRLVALKRKADIEADFEYNKKYIGSLMTNRDRIIYFKEIDETYKNSKKVVSLLW